MKFPSQIFVTIVEDGDTSFLSANETTDNVEDNDIVAVYKLVETKKLQVTRELV